MGLLDNLKAKEEVTAQPVEPVAPIAEPVVEPVAPTTQVVEEVPEDKEPVDNCGTCEGTGLLGDPTGINQVCSACVGTGVKQ